MQLILIPIEPSFSYEEISILKKWPLLGRVRTEIFEFLCVSREIRKLLRIKEGRKIRWEMKEKEKILRVNRS